MEIRRLGPIAWSVMITTLLRILFGFALACLVAGLATVAFVMPPQELLALPEAERAPRLVEGGLLTLAAATQTAIFAAPFALVAVAIGEWQVLRGLFYHIIVGMLIAAGGFLALWAGEEFTAQSYFAMAAYLTAGLMGGFTYWLFSGRVAGDPRLRDDVLLPPPPASNRASSASAGAGLPANEAPAGPRAGAAGGSAAGKTAGSNTGTAGSLKPVGPSPSPALSPVPAPASPAGSASGTSLVAALQKPGTETRQPASPASSTPPGRGQDTSAGSAAGTPSVPRIGPAPQSGPGTGTSGTSGGTGSAGSAGPRPFPAPASAPSTTPGSPSGSSSGSPSGSPPSSGPGSGPDSGSRR